jgi:hypothetical protein
LWGDASSRKFAAEHREKLATRRAESNAEKMKQMEVAKKELETYDATRKVPAPPRCVPTYLPPPAPRAEMAQLREDAGKFP